MSTNVGSATGYLDLDISGFLAGLQSAQSAADKQTKNIATKIGNNLAGAGKSLSTAGAALTKSVTVPVAGAGAAIVKLSADFESAMSKVSAISGATGDDLEALNAKAQEMGAKTKFSATEAAEAFTYMAMAGWKTEAMMEGIDGIMNLAAADGLDLATTSDIVTDALTAFGLSASDSAHFADVLAKASSAANTNVSMLGESFKYVAPVAGALGYSAEDTAVALGLMANSGIKASQSGTALRGALTRMIDPSKDAAAIMSKYGLSVKNSDGSMKSLSEVMVMLRTKMGGLSEAQQAQAASTLFGQEAMSGMLAIINASDQDFENLTNQIYNADGAAEQMASTMLNNLSGQITILKSSLEGLALQIGEILLPYVKQVVTWIQDLTQKLQSLTPEQKEQAVQWTAIAAAIGPALFAFGKVVSGLGSVFKVLGSVSSGLKAMGAGFTAVKTGGTVVTGVLGKLGGFFATTGGVVTIVVAAIAALVAAFIYLWNNCEGFRNFFIKMWENIKAAFKAFLDFISPAIEKIKGLFVSLWEKLQEIWNAIIQSLQPLIDQIVSAFQMAWDVIKLVWDYVQPYFAGIWEGIKAVFSIVSTWFSAIFGAAWEGVKAYWRVASSWYAMLWENIKAVFVPVVEFFKGIFSVAWEAIKAIWNVAISWFTLIWAGIEAVFAVVKGVLSGNFEDAWNAIKNVWDKAKNYFATLWEGVKNVFGAVGSFFKNVFGSAWEAIKKIFNNFGGFFSGLWNTIKNAFSEIGTKIGSAISGSVKAGINGVIGMIEGTVNSFIRMVNGAIKLINKIPGVEISKIKELDIPRLAKGAVLRPNNPFLAVVGDQTSGVNVEAPLATIQEAVANVIESFAYDIVMLQRESLRVLSSINDELGYISRNGFAKRVDSNVYESERSKNVGDGFGGNTFIFNSPRAIDEVEAAHQMKKAQRELAEGF